MEGQKQLKNCSSLPNDMQFPTGIVSVIFTYINVIICLAVYFHDILCLALKYKRLLVQVVTSEPGKYLL